MIVAKFLFIGVEIAQLVKFLKNFFENKNE